MLVSLYQVNGDALPSKRRRTSLSFVMRDAKMETRGARVFHLDQARLRCHFLT
jgi:hypothetical protein